MDTKEIEKMQAHMIIEIIEYIPQAVVSKTIIKKATGSVIVSSVDAGEELGDKISPFDIYVQIIDGAAELIINKKSIPLKLGEGIVIPAHSTYCFNATEQFKMITTTIKSGYED